MLKLVFSLLRVFKVAIAFIRVDVIFSSVYANYKNLEKDALMAPRRKVIYVT